MTKNPATYASATCQPCRNHGPTERACGYMFDTATGADDPSQIIDPSNPTRRSGAAPAHVEEETARTDLGFAIQQSSVCMRRLPEAANVKAVEGVVIADKRTILHLALRDEHAVERVAVFGWQMTGSLCMQ